MVLDKPSLNAAMVGVSLRVMSREFHTSAAKFRVVQCPHLLEVKDSCLNLFLKVRR